MTPSLKSRLRNWLAAHGWPPESRLTRFGLYLLAVDLVFFVLQQGFRVFHLSLASYLQSAVTILSVTVIFIFVIVAYRFVRQKLLWGLRNRLIVTYVFIGVIPAFLLVTMAALVAYLFAGQFSTFVVTSNIATELKTLETTNLSLTLGLLSRLDRKEAAPAVVLEDLRRVAQTVVPHEVCGWYDGKSIASEPPCSFEVPQFFTKNFQDVVRDRGALYLRAGSISDAHGKKLQIVSSAPFDENKLGMVSAGLGKVSLYSLATVPRASEQENEAETPSRPSGIVIRRNQGELVLEDTNMENSHPSLSAGTAPAANGSLDFAISFAAPLNVLDWKTGQLGYGALMIGQTRPSLLYKKLFSALGEYAYATEVALLAVALSFAVIVLLALFIGSRLTRTMTRSVANLYTATQHIHRGDLSHRIEVREKDQLAELQKSFNTMTASLEKLIVEQREKQRLENELAIAQEVQAQLFPKQISQLDTLEVHGFCRPARTVSGDYYDFLSIHNDKLGLAVGDVSGKGISAALLMATIHSAIRAYVLEGVPMLQAVGAGGANGHSGVELSPSALIHLLNHQLYSTTPTEKYATLFLGLYDGHARRLTYTNAGHLPPFLISEEGGVRRLEDGGTVVGLFDDMPYQEKSVDVRSGDLFLAYSDGVTEPENDFGEFGEGRLIDLVRANRHLSLDRISEVVTSAVYDWIGANEQPDDVTLVLARAR